MKTKDEVIEHIKKIGYSIVSEYDDPAGEYFAIHTHPIEEYLVVMRGNLEINMEGKKYVLNPGDELLFPALMPHDARMGSEGCFYIVGEKEANV